MSPADERKVQRQTMKHRLRDKLPECFGVDREDFVRKCRDCHMTLECWKVQNPELANARPKVSK